MMRADTDLVVRNSVESYKVNAKSHQCPEKDWEKTDLKILETSHDFALNRDSLEKIDPVYYMNKNVMACDLPEIVVCYKDTTYNVVKDICVDEGIMPVQEKFLFGEKDFIKCSSNSDRFSSDDTEIFKKDRDFGESLRQGLSEADSSSNCNQEKAMDSLETESDENSNNKKAESENVLQKSLTLGCILSMKDEQKHLSNNIVNRSEEQSLPQFQEKEKRELEKTEETEKTEHKLFSDRFGETSFSVTEEVSISGHITYTGPITISGSLSVRSDASTTSGKSFAFPILQSEWNHSPVRMAKAEKRRDKGWGWRHFLVCCRLS